MESTVYKHSLFIAAGLRVVGECILAIFDSPGVKANLVPCTVKLNVYKKRTNFRYLRDYGLAYTTGDVLFLQCPVSHIGLNNHIKTKQRLKAGFKVRSQIEGLSGYGHLPPFIF